MSSFLPPDANSAADSLLAIMADPKGAKARLDQFRAAEASANDAWRKVREGQAKLDADRQEHERNKAHLDDLNAAAARLDAAKEQIETAKRELGQREANIQARESAVDSRNANMAEREAELSRREGDLNTKCGRLDEELNKLNASREAHEARVKMLQSLAKRGEI